MTYAKAETLVGAVVAPLDWTRSALLVLGFSLLTAAAAQLVVPLPFTPVPLTGQTFAVLLTGALLGPRRRCAVPAGCPALLHRGHRRQSP